MKTRFLLYFILLLLISCSSKPKGQKDKPSINVLLSEDKRILEKVFNQLGNQKDTPLSNLIIKTAIFFKGTPYVAHTLEADTEKLVVNLREMDCTTFVENCLAISRTVRSGQLTFDHFSEELKNIRYRNGAINGYPSRLHYFSDWIYDNQKKGIIKDVSKEFGQTRFEKEINFMSTHPAGYSQLKDNPLLVKIIADQEKIISSREMYYIPEEKIQENESKLMDGDIAAITTTIGGLDVSHIVILYRSGGHIHFIHASSMSEKVVISEETLKDYLYKSKSATGIILARPI